MRNKGTLYVLGCYILYGVLPIFWKTLSMVDAFYVLTARVFWSMVIMAVILVGQRRFDAIRAVASNRRELIRLGFAGIFVTTNWGLYIWAVQHNRILDGSLAFYMNPILAVLLGAIVFREKLTKLQWFSVAIAFTGLLIAAVRNGQFPWVALMIGGCFAIYGAIKKQTKTDAGISVFFETLILSPFALAFMLMAESRGTGAVGVLHGWQWLLLPAAGVVSTVPLLAYSKGIKSVSMSLSGILTYINPTLQLLVSVWLYGEEFTQTHAILFGFVWAGLILYLISSFLEERKRRQREEEHACV